MERESGRNGGREREKDGGKEDLEGWSVRKSMKRDRV